MDDTITQEQAHEELKKGYDEAEKILKDEDKLEKLLQQLEDALKQIPKIGDKLSYAVVFASMIRSYLKKEFRDVTVSSLLAIIAGVLYLLNHFDLIPDSIPVLGYADDAIVIVTAYKLAEKDVKKYIAWREENKKVLI